MRIFTIGFTKSTASDFFSRLKRAGSKSIIDTRVNRSSQLAGFAKEKDLRYFTSQILSADYVVESLLAPTKDMLKAYRNNEISWSEYEDLYLTLLDKRKVLDRIDLHNLDGSCLLCSEATPEFCHRRLAAEYIRESRENVEIIHL